MNTQLSIETYFEKAVNLLSGLIETPSISREEEGTAKLISTFLEENNIPFQRSGNNIWAKNEHFDPTKKTILLNSHHDTVKPNNGYTKDPFKAEKEDGKLFGLGSNDAGGALVSLMMTFLHFYHRELPYNLILATNAEEEISGSNGVESILKDIKPIDFGVIGEPTEMKMAVAEKGLIVLDCYAKGESGHAARDTGKNAIYLAMEDIQRLNDFTFEKESEYLGPIKMTTTMIDAGYQHNVIPDACHFVVDVRTTDAHTNKQVVEIIKRNLTSEVKPRSLRLNSSHLPEEMPVSVIADQLDIEKFGSPTCSDQALMDFPTFKMGPGKSERSHTADEFIYLNEIKEGIEGYIQLLEKLFNHHSIEKT